MFVSTPEGNAKPRVQTSTVRMPEFNKWTRGFALFGPDPRVREFSQLQGCPPLTPFPKFKLLIPEFEKFELGESHPGGGGRATRTQNEREQTTLKPRAWARGKESELGESHNSVDSEDRA
jgi:hypothetical protein